MNEKEKSISHYRVNRPERFQKVWRPFALDELLPQDHRVRAVWRFVDSLDLSPFYVNLKATTDTAGRNGIDPAILFALWLQAILDGVSAARELARCCERDIVYMWICGDVSVNYHTLSDFRTEHSDALNELLTDTVTTLLHQDIVTLRGVAQDGMRVRANAGKSSFRRKPTLDRLREETKERIEALERERTDNEQQQDADRRRKAAKERAEREQEERLERALKELELLKKKRESREKGSGDTARASTTDPEARVMKMPNGGFDPAYNIQFETDVDSRIIVGVDVSNSGSDRGLMGPMSEEVCRKYGRIPEEKYVDAAFATQGAVTQLESVGTKVIAPVPRANEIRKKGSDPHQRQKGDSDEYAAFRERMGEDEYKEKFKIRPSVAEFPNAECRNRGLYQFRVRGLKKVTAVALWHALGFNFLRMLNLEAIR